MPVTLGDRLTDAGIPAETIESFRRVAPLAINQSASTLDEEVKHVLRSGGEPLANFSASAVTYPPFIVCLAHHSPTDIFTLLAFSRDSIPRRLVRFGRDGMIVKRWQSQPYVWNFNDAQVLVAAVAQCKGYFVVDTTDENENDECRTDESSADRAECLRLTPRSKSASCNITDGKNNDVSSPEGEKSDELKQDSQEIRKIILYQLLLYCEGSPFHHPDPNFLMPLSKAIALELKRWRELCVNLPPEAVWPDLPPGQDEEKEDITKGEETEEDRLCGKVGTFDRDTFDGIMKKRKEQTARSGKLVKNVLCRMRSLLEGAASMETERITSAFKLGRFCITSLLSLVRLQRHHWENMFDSYDNIYDCDNSFDDDICGAQDVLQDICDAQDRDYKKKMDEIATALLDGHAEGKIKVCEYFQEETEIRDKEDFDIDAAAEVIIFDWKKNDADLLIALSSAFDVMDAAINSGDQVKQKAAADNIEREFNIREMKAQSNSVKNVARFVKLGNASDDWKEDTLEWTNDQEEAYISFGRRITASRLLFLVNQAGITDVLRCKVNNLQIYRDDYDSDDYDRDDNTYLEQADRFKSQWKVSITPILDSILVLISILSRDGDLCNASLLLVACCRILCRKEFLGQLRGKFCDLYQDDSCDAELMVMSLLSDVVAKFDVCAIRLAFRYFENDAGTGSFEAGAFWLYNVLKSGIISFPDKHCDIDWCDVVPGERWKEEDSKNPSWFNFAHQAIAIYSSRGWRHPILCHALSEDAKPEDINEWASRESPLVIKERFLAMKDKNDTKRAISLAKMMQGDHEALDFLLSVGLASDAVEQASRSYNKRGLMKLAFDLIDSDKRASFLCAQSHILCEIEEAEQNDGTDVLQLDSINIFVDLFLKKYICLSVNSNTSGDETTSVSVVPSLSHLSIMAVTREFLTAATSTSKMQGILERFGTKIFVSDFDISFFLAVASLAMICQSAPFDKLCRGSRLKYALNRAGLLSEYDKNSFAYSGLLSVYEFSHDSPSKENLVRLSYAVFECSKYEMERTPKAGSSIGVHFFYVATGLLCTVYAAIHSGCHNLALHTIQTIKTRCDEGFRSRDDSLPFISLASTFSKLVFSVAYSHRNLLKQLLETALSLRKPLVRDNIKREQIWVALAYKEYVGAELSGSLLAESAFFIQRSDHSKFYGPVKVLKSLSLVDTEKGEVLAKYNAMSAFALSSQRVRLSRSERQQMCSAYFYRLLTLASLSRSHIAPGCIAECVRIDSALNPSFWNINSEQVDAWLSQSTGLASCFSDKKGLNFVCQTLYFVESRLNRGETWSTKYFIFACGLGWLRSILLSTKLPEFDHTQEGKFSNFRLNRFIRNNATLFELEDWSAREIHSTNRLLINRPILSVYAITTIVEKYAIEIEELGCNISNLCHEALLMCRIMFFLLIPNSTNFEKITNIYPGKDISRELSFQLPLHVEPKNLLDIVLRCAWGMEGTFPCKKDKRDESLSDSDLDCSTPQPFDRVILPHFFARTILALEQDRIKEAQLLCVTQGKSGILWDKKPSVRENIRELLQACLFTLQGAAIVSTELQKDFVNIFTHIILTINWFKCCTKCSLNSKENLKPSHEVVPSVENIKTLRNTASFWSNKGSQSSPFLNHCVRVICCLDRCYASFESVLLPGVDCHCRIKDEVYDSKVVTEPSICPSSREKRQAQRVKRKRQCNLDVEADFKELHSFIAQIHSKKTSDLITHVLPRIIAAIGISKKRRFV